MQVLKAHAADFLEISKAKIKTMTELNSLNVHQCIFTKGVFDIVHYGHLSLFNYLNELKSKTHQKVIVAVTSDQLVKQKKGPSRPINCEDDRALMIASLLQVDYVYIHNEKTYNDALKMLQPSYYIKGMDTTLSDDNNSDLTVKNPELLALDSQASFVIFFDDSTISTSSIVNKIKQL